MLSKKDVIAEYLHVNVDEVKEISYDSNLFVYGNITYEILNRYEMEDRFKEWIDDYICSLSKDIDRIASGLENYVDWDRYFEDIEYEDIEDFILYMSHKDNEFYYIQKA